MTGQPDHSDQTYNIKQRRQAFMEDFGPEHRLWSHIERGTQIVTGLFLITMAGFLGESWGNDGVPYAEILRAIGWVGYCFFVITLMTPATVFVIVFLRRLTPLNRGQRGLVYFCILMGTGAYCWFNLWAGTVDVIRAIAVSQGVEIDFGNAYYAQPWRD